MKFLKNLGIVFAMLIAFIIVVFVATALFVFPYIFITGEAPLVGLVQLWYLLLMGIGLAALMTAEE